MNRQVLLSAFKIVVITIFACINAEIAFGRGHHAKTIKSSISSKELVTLRNRVDSIRRTDSIVNLKKDFALKGLRISLDSLSGKVLASESLDTSGVENRKKLNEVLPKLVNNVIENILAYAMLLAAISTIVMTMLELLKGIGRFRCHYNRQMFRRWIRQNLYGHNYTKGHLIDVYMQFVTLSVSDLQYADAMFDQDTDKMMGLIQSSANIALDYPNEYPDLYFCITNANGHQSTKNSVEQDATLWMQQAGAIKQIQGSGIRPETITIDVQNAAQAKARLDHFVSRKLDAFQIKNNFYWTRFNQVVSICLAAMFIYLLLRYIGIPLLTNIVLSVFGGMIAPFAKDVVNGLAGAKVK